MQTSGITVSACRLLTSFEHSSSTTSTSREPLEALWWPWLKTLVLPTTPCSCLMGEVIQPNHGSLPSRDTSEMVRNERDRLTASTYEAARIDQTPDPAPMHPWHSSLSWSTPRPCLLLVWHTHICGLQHAVVPSLCNLLTHLPS